LWYEQQVLEISAADIQPSPSLGTSVRTDLIAGMGRVGDKFVILLNLDSVLSVDDVETLASAAMPHSATPLATRHSQHQGIQHLPQ